MGDQTFARLIRMRRDALGLSQARLGELVGRSATTIRNWERAQASPSVRSDVVALAAVLGLNEGEVLEQAGFEPPSVEESPTMEQAYASLTSEPAKVIPKPWMKEPSEEEPAAIPEPEPVESTPPREEMEVEVRESFAPETLDTPQPVTVTPAPVEAVPSRPDTPSQRPTIAPIVAESAAAAQAAPDSDSAIRRTRRAAPPTVLEAAPPGEASYIEDADERERYRVRAVATAALVVAIVIVLLWSFDRATDALAGMWDVLIDSLAI